MSFSLDTVMTAVVNNIKGQPKAVLDIGSGDGKLLNAIKALYPEAEVFACDYTDEFLKAEVNELKIADLNSGELPFEDQSFDLVTITEVVEHLENYHAIIREIHRILRPEGQVIITTPNILNLKSRVGFLTHGFWNLFGPLPLTTKKYVDTSGHITPVHTYHLFYSLTHAGFGEFQLKHDKVQRSSLIWFILLFPLLFISNYLYLKREREKFKSVDESNDSEARSVNSFCSLTARSIVVTASRKA